MVALKKVSPTRSDLDWREAKAQAALALKKQFAGFIFVCNNATVPDPQHRLFGLPAHHKESVRAIRPGMPIFLYNYSTRLLHGVFEAVSNGGFNLDPHAWEDTEMVKIGKPPVSRYPAQVRVGVRAMCPPLGDEIFRPALDNWENYKFKLELTQYQVELLLDLFGVSGSDAELDKLSEGTKRHFDNCSTVIQEPESPGFVCKSDSDSSSASFGGGISNFYKDEWSDETFHEDSANALSHGNQEDFLSPKITQLKFEESKCNVDMPLVDFSIKPDDLSDSAGLKSRMHVTSQENGTMPKDGCIQQNALKGMLRKPFQSTRSELLNAPDMLLRLHDVDPAVNSNATDFGKSGVHQVRSSSKRQGNKLKAPFFMSQVQSPLSGDKKVLFIPVSRMHYQQRGSSDFDMHSQRRDLNEPRKIVHGSAGQNLRKQQHNKEKSGRQKSIKPIFGKQQVASGHQHHPSKKPTNIQLREDFVPHCMQDLVPVQEQRHLTAAFPPFFLSQDTSLSQSHITGSREDHDELHDINADIPCHRNGQSFLQNGQWDSQVPVLLMPSVMQRIPGHSSPMVVFDVESLHYEILEFAKIARPSMDTQLNVEAAIDCVRKGIKSVWPEADVEVFGSFATGLCLRHSDVDLAVVGAPFPSMTERLSVAEASALLVRQLAQGLQSYRWCESISVIDTTSVPVLKCKCRSTDQQSTFESSSLPCVSIDITIGEMRNSDSVENNSQMRLMTFGKIARVGKFGNSHTGGEAREYVLHKIQDLPALVPLVLLLKSYLHHRYLSDVYFGGLGSFSLILLLAFYLEQVPLASEKFLDEMSLDLPMSPSVSSPLSWASEVSEDSNTASSSSSALSSDSCVKTKGEFLVKRATDVVDKVLLSWHSCGSPFLGVLLLGFLQTFGFELDLSTVKIVLKGAGGSPGGIFERDGNTRHLALWIDDPLRPGINVGAGSYAMGHVQVAFQEMLQILTNRKFFALPQNAKNILNNIPGIGSLCQLRRVFMADNY